MLAPYKMASREVQEGAISRADGLEARPLHGSAAKKVAVIAGPCSVENRINCWRPRMPSRRQGPLGCEAGHSSRAPIPIRSKAWRKKGWSLLALAREETGLAVVTEVMAVDQVELVARYADVLQVGARNMQNFNLLNAVGEQSKPVLLKRG